MYSLENIPPEIIRWLPAFTILALIWTVPWKGVALWRAARNGQKWWFMALLVINTLAILEIIYIFGFGKKAKKN